MRPCHYGSGGFVAEDKRGRAALVMAEKRMHVGSADPDRFHPDQSVVTASIGIRHVAKFHLLRAGIYQELSFGREPSINEQCLPGHVG